MFAQPSGVFGVGTEPPPDSTLPRPSSVIWCGSSSIGARSAWVICPTFSGRVIRASRSWTRCCTGRCGFMYGGEPLGGPPPGGSW
jgi:hypothetical protein